MASPLAKVDPAAGRRALALAVLNLRARADAVVLAVDPARLWTPHPYQLPPDGEWTNWLLMGGRGSGKTAAGANAMDEHARSAPCLTGRVPHRMGLVAPTADDAIKTCIRGETGLLTLDTSIDFSPGARLRAALTWPNGAEAEYYGTYGPEDVERFRGPQYCFVWGDELAAWRKLDEVWPMLDLGLRLGPRPRRVLTTTPKPRKRLKLILADPATAVTRVRTDDNPSLSAERRAEFYKAYGGTRIGRQELDAEILDDVDGALWKRDMIESTRRTVAPELIRIVVAVDPSVTGKETSDEAGIIAAGIDALDRGYVLDDRTLRGSPLTWARAAITAYQELKADRVIGEINNGGEMIELTLRTVDKSVAYTAVHASRGKRTRAEPVAALYEQGRISHVGTFPELEDEMCGWIPDESPSPNRMDALVWALSDLLVHDEPGILAHYRSATVTEPSQPN